MNACEECGNDIGPYQAGGYGALCLDCLEELNPQE